MTARPKHLRRGKVASVTMAAFVVAWSGSAHAADPDPWLGPDKQVHFTLSAALGAGGYGVSAFFLERPWQRTVAGAGFSLTLGAGKELYDLTGHGDPSWKDFTWDVAGTALGVGVALLIDLGHLVVAHGVPARGARHVDGDRFLTYPVRA